MGFRFLRSLSSHVFTAKDVQWVRSSRAGGRTAYFRRPSNADKIRPVDQTVELGPGDVLSLKSYLYHDVETIEESAFFLTISWPKDGAPDRG